MFWIDAYRKIIHDHLSYVISHLLWMNEVIGQCLHVRDHDKGIVRMLELYSIGERASVMTEVKLARGTVAGQNSFLVSGHRSDKTDTSYTSDMFYTSIITGRIIGLRSVLSKI